MNKLLLLILLVGFWMSLYGLQSDQELAFNSYFEMKHSLNRATHAAAQQVDLDKLSAGVWDIDRSQAWEAARLYLRGNLQLDEQLHPMPGSYLLAPVLIRAFEVIGADSLFPYRYVNSQYEYEVILQRPGIVLIVEIQYPRMYGLLNPVTWLVKSSSELVYGGGV